MATKAEGTLSYDDPESDEDSDMDDKQSRALYVDLDEEDEQRPVDLNAPAASVKEYIRQVRFQAKQLGQIAAVKPSERSVAETSAPKVRRTVRHPRSMAMSELLPTLPKAKSPEYVPGLEWQREKVSTFSQMRLSWEQQVAGLRKDAPHWAKTFVNKKLINDRLEAESTFQEGLYGRIFNSDPQDEEQYLPLTSIIACIPPESICRSLSVLAQMSEKGISDRMFLWIFALLLALQKPVSPETLNDLRNLARACAKMRSQMDSPQDPRLTSCNTLICLIGRYFNQTDLADDRESY